MSLNFSYYKYVSSGATVGPRKDSLMAKDNGNSKLIKARLLSSQPGSMVGHPDIDLHFAD